MGVEQLDVGMVSTNVICNAIDGVCCPQPNIDLVEWDIMLFAIQIYMHGVGLSYEWQLHEIWEYWS